MAQRMQTNRLDLWMNGLPVGYWESGHQGERLVYRSDWIEHPQGRPLSLSLPFAPDNQAYRGQVVADYFDNLLPDSEPIRRRIALRHKTGGTSPFALLARLGRDCVGALQLLPPGEVPIDLESIAGMALDEHEIASLLRDTTASSMGQSAPGNDLRLSIAGAQEKTALLRHEGRWLLPHGSTPTTHIFKLPLGRVGNMQANMRTSVENEWLCAQIVAAYGLPIARCEIGQFEDCKALIVERFDRRPSVDTKWILRLPQEDMCQATGTPALYKYQSDGGPGIETVMQILGQSESAAKDRRHFFMTQMVFWVLAATDGHAKNFSIAHLPGNRYASTPLYDVLSAHSIIGKASHQLAAQKARLAMAVRGKNLHYPIEQVQHRHWLAQGQRVGFSSMEVTEMIGDLTARTAGVIDAVSMLLPENFPGDVAEAIFSGMRRLNGKLARAAPT